MKITVMAGTPIDTQMGVNLLHQNNYKDIIQIPISSNPKQQTLFQNSSVDYKEKIIRNHIQYMKSKGSQILFVYCNSLSSSVDFETISKIENIKIVTPLDLYKNIAMNNHNVFILAANGQSLCGIEKIMYAANEDIKLYSMALLELVNDIEEQQHRDLISKKFNLQLLCTYINSLNLDKLLLACTHFPYIESELEKYLNIKIENPNIFMLEKLRNLEESIK